MHAHEVEMSIWENSGDWPKNARLAIEEIADQRNALRDEVAELKRKIAEVEGERDALLALNAEMLAALNGYAYGIKSCGHNLVCICNQVKAEAIIAKIEGREINPWLRNSPAK